MQRATYDYFDFQTKNRYKEELHKLKFHIDSVHVLEENETPDPHHDFTLAAHMKNILLEKDSVHGNQGSPIFSRLY